MLTSSPTIAGATSASPKTLHYATSRSPQQSPKITVPLPRRQSRHSLSRSSPSTSIRSPSLSRPKQYVGVDAATQYSPMEPFDPMVPLRAASVSGPRISSSTAAATAIATAPATVMTTTEIEPKPAILETSVEPNISSGRNAEAQHQVQIQTLSPNKRRKSQDPIAAQPSSSIVALSQPSSPKRSRPNEGPPKVLPLRYELCDVEDMVVLISNMLGELIETNDSIAMKSAHLTRFHSRTAPGISVLDYLQRLAKHATLTPPLLLSMVSYIDRLCEDYPDFTINTLTVHRFLITAATVAGKGLSDSFWNNSFYARVGGVKVAELKLLELEFLGRVDWRIVPNPEVLVAYYKGLVARCPGYSLQDELSLSAPGFKPHESSMKFLSGVYGLTALALASLASTAASDRTAAIYIQPVSLSAGEPASAPAPLAEVRYDASAGAEVVSYEAPELPEGTRLVRVGVWDAGGGRWASSTTVGSADNFGKGLAPALLLSVDARGDVLSAALRGVRIDAGQTRDFGPRALLLPSLPGRQPELNKPVVLSPEGKTVAPEEKTLFQKYWWVMAVVLLLTMSGGGGDQGK
ncbi:cyclin-domain-containing protein [Durotheca rogersii]|uniref:cyclin-domain-containing protein n=1 Tax=Durotheca rogersii TaxID=419775 RepID=UPI002220B901|nr:cyclin-domain-containing protein [Durotheca rogersii]KAI5862320.1 cyclin-domain-containing protein [Durotheca rogersii]